MNSADERLKLANKVIGLFNAVLGFNGTWVPHLIDRSLDKQGYLRNKVFLIYILGLVDAAEDFEVEISKDLSRAEAFKNESAKAYLNALRFHLSLIADFIALYSRKEMVFLNELRLQAAHGRLNAWTSSTRTVPHYKDGRVRREKLAPTEYWAEFRETMEAYSSSEDAITALRRRFCEHRTLFWVSDRFLAHPLVRQSMQADILKGGRPSGLLVTPANRMELATATRKHGTTLIEVRKKFPVTDGEVFDPVVA